MAGPKRRAGVRELSENPRQPGLALASFYSPPLGKDWGQARLSCTREPIRSVELERPHLVNRSVRGPAGVLSGEGRILHSEVGRGSLGHAIALPPPRPASAGGAGFLGGWGERRARFRGSRHPCGRLDGVRLASYCLARMDARGARHLAVRRRAGVLIGMRLELDGDAGDDSPYCRGSRHGRWDRR